MFRFQNLPFLPQDAQRRPPFPAIGAGEVPDGRRLDVEGTLCKSRDCEIVCEVRGDDWKYFLMV